MYFVRMLFHIMPFILVELGEISWTGSSYAGIIVFKLSLEYELVNYCDHHSYSYLFLCDISYCSTSP